MPESMESGIDKAAQYLKDRVGQRNMELAAVLGLALGGAVYLLVSLGMEVFRSLAGLSLGLH